MTPDSKFDINTEFRQTNEFDINEATKSANVLEVNENPYHGSLDDVTLEAN